ncbi:prolyl oligopeptidase family serine peptidase [Parabacteroides sp. FAFU027]|uniref:S9 family peptidase n=1 Tax=Parabacteroides sp. FAFU027 TaxID=2922715 RepID=UPI001FAF4A32|nr:prolyl oligopeptidase family serine peptidase [Parabacteroides sp. FAFU027]
MKKIFLCVLLGTMMLPAMAQRIFPVNKYLVYGPVKVVSPVLCDSVNAKGEKFKAKSLLKTTFLPAKESDFQPVLCDTSNVFRLVQPNYGRTMTLLKFYVTSDRFASMKITVQSTCRFEVYVDGELGGEKQTVEDSLIHAMPEVVSIKAEPHRYEVLVKVFMDSKDKMIPAVQAEVSCSKNDKSTLFTVTTDPHRNLYILDYLVGKRPASVAVSPNGKLALVRYVTTLKDATKIGTTQVVEIGSGKCLLTDDNNAKGVGWMPLSNKLYYATKGLNGRELHILDPVTLEDRVLTDHLPDGDFTWGPDERFLIYTGYEYASTDDNGSLKRLLSPEDRQADWRKRSYLSLYDIASGVMQRLTYGKANVSLQDIRFDGKAILFKEERDVVTERPFTASSLYQLKLDSMKLDTLWHNDKFATSATYSPDGKQIAITGAAESFDGIGLNIAPGQISNMSDIQMYMMDVATKKITPLTKSFSPSVSSLAWSKTDGQIYLKVVDEDYVRLYAYNPQRNAFRKLPLTPDVITGVDLANHGSTLLYYGQTLQKPGLVYSYDLKSQREKLVADPSAERLKDIAYGKVEDWNFKSADSTLIKGRCYLPPAFDAAKKYPLIVFYYGGTTPTDRSFESRYPLSLYASMGYVVYTLQPSGAIGFGQEFSARHVNAWGEKTADEIILGTKLFCRQHTYVDSTHIGCIGASYGGFMTMYLQTKTDLFAAAISHAGISDISSYWGEGYWGYTYSGLAAAKSYPWNNRELYVDHSPLFNANKINTPLLLLHGTADTNVPMSESIRMYTALKVLGKPVEFIRVEGENHHVLDMQKRYDWQKTILAWFDKYLRSDSRWWNDMYKANPIEE